MALITPELAREYARRANEAKRARIAREAEEARLRAENPPKAPLDAESDPYVQMRLTRVRKQLDSIDRMLAGETDPRRLRDLAAVARDLGEQERQLAGRPLPGSKRPRSEPARRMAAPAPLD